MVFFLFLLLTAAHAASSDACAPCHREIYDRYRRTPMAGASGVPSGEDLARSSFTHSASGFRYRVYRDTAGLQFEFAKTGGALRGSRALPQFVGSGATARSYL